LFRNMSFAPSNSKMQYSKTGIKRKVFLSIKLFT
jgi:hypothetical protein